MFRHRITLFHMFGFAIRIDASWLFLAILITWSLAEGAFPVYYKGASPSTYWLMGVVGALGLFVSIILHELAHAVVARRYGIPIKGITLFIFGGVAEMETQPPNAKSEFLMAIAGPIASLVVGGVFYAMSPGALSGEEPIPLNVVLAYLGIVNVILAVFNMVPAFPLDGGRVLRAALWGIKGDLNWATRISSTIGRAFGMLLIGLGIFAIVSGNIVGGIWWIMIGMFMRGASRMSYQQLIVQKMLKGQKVRRFMRSDPVSIPAAASLRGFADHYAHKLHQNYYPVTDDGVFRGLINARVLDDVPEEEWDQHTINQELKQPDEELSIGPDGDAMDALNKMTQAGEPRLFVVEDGNLIGEITLQDLQMYLSSKLTTQKPPDA